MRDVNGQPNIIGDGINVAERVMSFARPGQVLVSRSYYEVVTRNCADYAAQFSYQGSRTDKHVREHEIFEVASGQDQALEVAAQRHHVRAEQQADRHNAGERMQPAQARSASGWLAHRGFAYGAVVVSSALLLAAIAFYMLDPGPSQPTASVTPTVAARNRSARATAYGNASGACASGRAANACRHRRNASSTCDAGRSASGRGNKAGRNQEGAARGLGAALGRREAASRCREPSTGSGVIERIRAASEAAAWKPAAAPADKPVAMAPATQPQPSAPNPLLAARPRSCRWPISPWGEVLVDGKPMGVSPPMSELELAPAATASRSATGTSNPISRP